MVEASWQLKIARATEHVQALRGEMAAYLADEPFALMAEQQPGRLQLSIDVRRPVPARWSTIVGDVLHNARSAMDAALLSAVIQEQADRGRSLSSDDQRPLQFPIAKNPTTFDEAWRRRRGPSKLSLEDLMPAQGYKALRSVQPFRIWEQVAEDEERSFTDTDAEYGSAHEALPRLQELSNIDKHRHVHLLPMLPSTVSHPPVEGATWQFSPAPLTDHGGVVGWLTHGDLELPSDFAAEIHPIVVMPAGENGKQFYAFPVDVTHDLDSLVGSASTAITEFLARLKPAPDSPINLIGSPQS